MSIISENIDRIKNDILECEKKSGRQAGSVKLMAVSKFHSVSEINQAINSNQFLFGENRVQEAVEKFLLLNNPNIELHIIGSLQTNKVKNAVKISSCIESVDRIKLLEEIEKQSSKIDKSIKILFEYHTAEDSKSGFVSKDELYSVLEMCSNGLFPHVIPCGFMTMAPFTKDESLIRKSFITLRELSEKCKTDFPNLPLNELSMGMSGDYKIAIEEGSTQVRVGTSIFGERDYSKR